MSTRTILLLISILMVPWLAGCHHSASPKEKGREEACRTDSFIALYRDSILEEPSRMKEQTLHDSISYYKATVFAAFCCYHNAQHDSASLLLAETGKFCQRQEKKSPRLYELKGYLYNYSGHIKTRKHVKKVRARSVLYVYVFTTQLRQLKT